MTRHITFMTIDDAEHYSDAEKARIVSEYLPHERDARARGIPVLGSGAVFPIAEEAIRCAPMPIPAHWVQINGLDFGWDHPFGAVNCAWDRDADVFYVLKEYREREATPVIHAAAVKPWGLWIPCAWPKDGLQHEKGAGKSLAPQYKEQGLAMLPDWATFEDERGVSVEAGVTEMLTRMQTGRWKVFSTCGAWLGEFRLYHREDGIIVKLQDDLISASRYALMMKRHAAMQPKPRPTGPHRVVSAWS